jgi:hypothetical protein
MKRLATVMFACLLSALSVPLFADIAAAGMVAPPTLRGEVFHTDNPTVTSIVCDLPQGQVDAAFEATGTASGPYPGTFHETGRLVTSPGGIGWDLTLTFSIDSSVGKVTGTKQATVLGLGCSSTVLSFNTANNTLNPTEYIATIYIDAGAFSDNGHFDVNLLWDPAGAVPDSTFDESFQSQLDSPTPSFPTSKAGCMNGKWRSWSVGFKNQGTCLSYLKG